VFELRSDWDDHTLLVATMSQHRRLTSDSLVRNLYTDNHRWILTGRIIEDDRSLQPSNGLKQAMHEVQRSMRVMYWLSKYPEFFFEETIKAQPI